MTLPHPLILASASAARARVLAGAGIAFAVEPADVDEAVIKETAKAAGVGAEEAALRLAMAKAIWVGQRQPNALVIGADQMLECEGRWFDKPMHREDAREHLSFLRGREQHLISAVAVTRDDIVLWQTVDAARLRMRPFSEQFLDDYLTRAGDDACRSVGGCQLEGFGIQFFDRVDGDFFTILGLPLLPLLAFLRDQGVVGR